MSAPAEIPAPTVEVTPTPVYSDSVTPLGGGAVEAAPAAASVAPTPTASVDPVSLGGGKKGRKRKYVTETRRSRRCPCRNLELSPMRGGDSSLSGGKISKGRRYVRETRSKRYNRKKNQTSW